MTAQHKDRGASVHTPRVSPRLAKEETEDPGASSGRPQQQLLELESPSEMWFHLPEKRLPASRDGPCQSRPRFSLLVPTCGGSATPARLPLRASCSPSGAVIIPAVRPNNKGCARCLGTITSST